MKRSVQGCDLLHVPDYGPVPRGAGAAVVTVHDLASFRTPEAFTGPAGAWKRRTTARSLKRAGAVICVSEFTADELRDLFRVPESKLHVVRNGVSPFPDPGRDPEDILAEHGVRKPFLLSVGTLEPRKNHERLLEAYSRLRAEPGIPHRLLILGRKGWKWTGVFETLSRLRLEDHVTFVHGARDDLLSAAYRAADALVYPSLYEGFGLPPLEAMISGTPAVVSSIPPHREVAGNAARFVDPEDPEDIADGIREVLCSAELRERLVREGFERVRELSWSRTARETLSVYESLRSDPDRT
jgi:glycosyltransferase involved in cell wall biosynthesis